MTEYYHDVWCNASRQLPMGNPSCSCAMYKRARRAEQFCEHNAGIRVCECPTCEIVRVQLRENVSDASQV